MAHTLLLGHVLHVPRDPFEAPGALEAHADGAVAVDAQGRVAARVLGAVEESTLRALLTTVVDEAAA